MDIDDQEPMLRSPFIYSTAYQLPVLSYSDTPRLPVGITKQRAVDLNEVDMPRRHSSRIHT
jgi:hypothetical protein